MRLWRIMTSMLKIFSRHSMSLERCKIMEISPNLLLLTIATPRVLLTQQAPTSLYFATSYQAKKAATIALLQVLGKQRGTNTHY